MPYSSTSAKLGALIQASIEHSSRLPKVIVEDYARNLSFSLFGKTKATSPTASRIAADAALKHIRIKPELRAKLYGQTDPATGQKYTYAGMQREEVKRRQRGINFIASGWLPAIRRFGRGDKGTIVQVANPRGSVTVDISESVATITIENHTPGVESNDSRHQILASSIDELIAKKLAHLHSKGVAV